ncbi:MAG: hypothetical protein JST68_17275 [Bacteroidetes bacterium]|nr:hypothetical protein [Bacteroidota bacterium]
MIRHVLFVSVVVCILGACSSSKSNLIKKDFTDLRYYAWYEDSSRTLQFSAFRKGIFQYVTVKKAGKPRPQFYDGRMRRSGDTIYLDYKRDRPVFLKPFLIQSGSYFVQQYANQGRVFLRIESFGHMR